eukprot:1160511-Pelagomonas_calceolata.AAC.4
MWSTGEQRWQQRDDLFRVSMRPRQGGAIAKSQQSAYGQKPSHAFLFVGSRYQAQRERGWDREIETGGGQREKLGGREGEKA